MRRRLPDPVGLALVLGTVVVACSAFEPEVGPPQASKATMCSHPPSAGGGNPYIYGASDSGQSSSGGPTPANASDPRCQPDSGYVGGACDACENTYCCATRFACYDDPACACADVALDACLSALTTDSGAHVWADGGRTDAASATPAPGSGSVAQCWAQFAATDSIAQGRVDC